MKAFRCGDEIPGCTIQLLGKTDEDILIAVAVHAAHEHGIAEVPPEVVEQVRSLIRVAV